LSGQQRYRQHGERVLNRQKQSDALPSCLNHPASNRIAIPLLLQPARNHDPGVAPFSGIPIQEESPGNRDRSTIA
jgi:hypothetical protein